MEGRVGLAGRRAPVSRCVDLLLCASPTKDLRGGRQGVGLPRAGGRGHVGPFARLTALGCEGGVVSLSTVLVFVASLKSRRVAFAAFSDPLFPPLCLFSLSHCVMVSGQRM